MDIDILSGLIRDIIIEKDSVTLPSLGLFVAEMAGASFSDRGYSIAPPYRKLSFRQRSEDEDNALVRLYARRCSEGLSREDEEARMAEAEKEISEFMEGLKEVLLRDKLVIFPGLGRLRATRENNIFFVPDEDLDIFPDGFGLETISLKSLDTEGTVITPIPTHKPEFIEKNVDVPKKKRSSLKTVVIATLATAAVLAGALAILGRTCPQVIDPLLYTPEELAIINYPDA